MNLWPDAKEWATVFISHVPWAEKAIRPILVYGFLLFCFRLTQRRELSQATIFDFIIVLLISNVVQNAIIGDDNSILGSFVGVITLLALSAGLDRLTARSKKARKILEGTPELLIHNGNVLQKVLDKNKISFDDLYSALRREGIASTKDVRYAVLEVDGHISVIRTEDTKSGSQDECITSDIRETWEPD